MSEVLLQIDDLQVHFDTDDGVVKAVDGVSLEVKRGEMVGIVGESGSGKSVASMTILGLTRASNAEIAGRISFEGRDLVDDERGGSARDPRQRDLDDLPGPALLAASRSTRWASSWSRRSRCTRTSTTRRLGRGPIELLELVGIPDPQRRIGEYPHEFSGGMRQRVMIAMALTNDPKLLIADEPTTALDVTTQAQILQLIERLREEFGMAVIMITHDLGVIAEVADRVHRHVRRPRGRVGDARRDLLRPPAPVHVGPARIADPDRQTPFGPAGPDRGPAAVADQPAERMPASATAARTRFDQLLGDARPGAADE